MHIKNNEIFFYNVKKKKNYFDNVVYNWGYVKFMENQVKLLTVGPNADLYLVQDVRRSNINYPYWPLARKIRLVVDKL